jgi:hypothetical protein
VVGLGEGFNLVASDASPMIEHTNEFIELDDLEFGIVNKDKVVIKLFSGITIDSSIIPEREKRNNFTGEVVVYPPYIKPKFNVSKNYVRTLNRIT